MSIKVSIIVPTYNRCEYVWQAVQSVFAQTYKDYEIIIIDDGSTDSTKTMFQPSAESGEIKYYYQENLGRSAARNYGLRMAQGEYIAFLDSDDIWLPEKLQKQVVCLDEQPEVGLIQSWFTKFDHDSGLDLGVRNTNWFSGTIYPQILLHWSGLMAIDAVLIRRSVLNRVGYFDEEIHHGEDLDLWRRISRWAVFGVIPESLTRVRVHSGSLSAQKLPTSAAFRVYLMKAFADDPSLSVWFRRKALARMYSYSGYNQLSVSTFGQTFMIWRDCWNALINWPFEWNAYLCLFVSLIPSSSRKLLYKLWSTLRYS